MSWPLQERVTNSRLGHRLGFAGCDLIPNRGWGQPVHLSWPVAILGRSVSPGWGHPVLLMALSLECPVPSEAFLET